ncbi:MAG: ABC transporter substrate-binding protein [Candidatus Sedimenticola sp. 20ELBAFRAG]
MKSLLRSASFLLLILAPLLAVAGDSLLFFSTQFAPVDEARRVREEVLSGFGGSVDFQPFEERETFFALVKSEGKRKPGLIGGLHGDMVSLGQSGLLQPVEDLAHGDAMVDSYVELGRLGSANQYYIPWIQATYIMAANRRALEYLPQGADINALTYDQFKSWAENMYKASGEPKLGLPAGPKGLLHRLLQGYLYPSFTGGMVRSFKSDDAVGMWKYLKDLWGSVNPRSLSFDSMHEPLLSEEVWVAWDHTARLMPAIEKRPDDFVVFPVPAGPKGRGFMVVLGGLAIPVAAPDPEASRELVAYLSSSKGQLAMLRNTGFFPVLKETDGGGLSPSIDIFKQAVARQSASPDGVSALLPVGLGQHGGDFSTVYKLAFSRIILRNKKIGSVLKQQGRKLEQLLENAAAPCWAPDKASEGPCPVE